MPYDSEFLVIEEQHLQISMIGSQPYWKRWRELIRLRNSGYLSYSLFISMLRLF